MKSSLTFAALLLFLVSPLPTLALIIDTAAPLGSPNNPINVLPVKTLNQTLQEHRQNFQDLQRQQQQAERDLWQGVRDRQNQPIQQNRVQPIAPNIVIMPSGQSAPQPTPSNTCPKNSFRWFEDGDCLCRDGHKWNNDRTKCELDHEALYRKTCGPRSKWMGQLTYYPNSIAIKCTCEAGFTLIDKPGYPESLQCPESRPAQKTTFWHRLLTLFGVQSDDV